ncbi:MAG: metal-dependent hydrolase [Vicinamibacterales bacterium]|jgi:inner membrane protein|nr:hydrolase [Acidobacteriota bacterium]MDP7472840.1 metal-dependent hydrolase [Vicinamibacterales bacterium]MDP7672439.1 metal-dependent hydrolase [Vicinamibacterales bacterium]HJO38514.1 metal-dependent hydrolase [Vicinamibacterales bacterium]|tara:strand:- start:853 stop:1956 length:1104 start_codon:yes stop_codon:yes gene_type:complete
MDPIAHTLVGASLAQTGLKRLSTFGTLTLLLAANAPDIDAFTMFLGRDVSLGARRGWTHGVLAMAVLPVALAGLVWLLGRIRAPRDGAQAPSFTPLLVLSGVGVLTHPLLDWLNTYGIRLLMPFDDRWFYGDALFIVDPWVWLLAATPAVLASSAHWPSRLAWLLGGAVATWIVVGTGLASWGIQAAWLGGLGGIAVLARSRQPRARGRFAVACLGAVALYAGAMVVGSRVAAGQADRWLASRGVEAVSSMAGPVAGNPFARDIIASTGDRYHFVLVDWLSDRPIQLSDESVPIGEVGPIVRAALAAPDIQGTRRWLRFPIYTVEPDADGYRVTIRDMRFARRAPAGLGVIEIDLTNDLRSRATVSR